MTITDALQWAAIGTLTAVVAVNTRTLNRALDTVTLALRDVRGILERWRP